MLRIHGVGTFSTSKTLSGLDPTTQYEFRVRALCDGSYGPYSINQWFYTSTCGSPENYSIIQLDPGKIRINWDVIPNATKYQVRYRQIGTSSWTVTGTLNPYKILNGLEEGGMYEYRVRSLCDGTHWSLYSLINEFAVDGPAMRLTNNSLGVHVYPNPVSDLLYINIRTVGKPVPFTLTDILGKTVVSGEIPAGQNQIQIPVNTLTKGTYFLSVQEDKQPTHIEKLIVR